MAEGKHALHGYVRDDVRDDFERACRSMGLTSESSYLTLLVLRELEMRELSPKTGADVGPRRSKVSAYLHRDVYERFKAHSDALSRNPSECAADLIERELSGKWLRSALTMPVPSR